jgi:hypothetical protein
MGACVCVCVWVCVCVCVVVCVCHCVFVCALKTVSIMKRKFSDRILRVFTLIDYFSAFFGGRGTSPRSWPKSTRMPPLWNPSPYLSKKETNRDANGSKVSIRLSPNSVKPTFSRMHVFMFYDHQNNKNKFLSWMVAYSFDFIHALSLKSSVGNLSRQSGKT